MCVRALHIGLIDITMIKITEILKFCFEKIFIQFVTNPNWLFPCLLFQSVFFLWIIVAICFLSEKAKNVIFLGNGAGHNILFTSSWSCNFDRQIVFSLTSNSLLIGSSYSNARYNTGKCWPNFFYHWFYFWRN